MLTRFRFYEPQGNDDDSIAEIRPTTQEHADQGTTVGAVEGLEITGSGQGSASGRSLDVKHGAEKRSERSEEDRK